MADAAADLLLTDFLRLYLAGRARRAQALDALQAGETVYKLMGKVLVKQDAADARSTVTRRLEFITAELCVASRSGLPRTV